MKKSIILVTVLLAALTACTDAMQGKISAFGGSANITCYSGDRLIYQGESTGKVNKNSVGYYFIDKADNKLKDVSGNCVITYNTY